MKHMQKGMTIVGVIVAGVILSSSMNVLVDYQNALSRIRFQQQHVALGNLLASEGVELARGVRDVKFAAANRSNASTTWDSGLVNGVYAHDYNLNLEDGFSTTTSCSDTTPVHELCRLRRDSVTGFYSHSGDLDEELEVYRFIEVADTTSPSDADQKVIISTVTLRSRGGKQSQYKAATILYNTDL